MIVRRAVNMQVQTQIEYGLCIFLRVPGALACRSEDRRLLSEWRSSNHQNDTRYRILST